MPAACDVESPFRIDKSTAQALADQFGTPLYVLSEACFRQKIRSYQSAFSQSYPDTRLSYASKANSTLALLKIAYAEGCLIDVASEGELRAALKAGVPAESCEMHGNNKSVEEILFAYKEGVRAIVVDNFEEIENHARLKGFKGHFILRLAPGVDPITHEKIQTGQEDSKFGFNISDGSAEKALLLMLENGLPVHGFHCHVGSQLLEASAQIAGGQALAEFAVRMLYDHEYGAQVINMGGGVGIRYTSRDKPISFDRYCKELVGTVAPILAKAGLEPTLMQEPGRSLVGECGITLYQVGAVKSVPAPAGRKTYVIVDGGLSDNPRPAMYDADYTVLSLSGSVAELTPCTVSGKHCETDKLFPSVPLPADISRGDLLQVLSTGAYNSSMSNNYNRYPRPATVLVREDGSFLLVQRRETWDELFAREIVPSE